ncbi:Maf family protein [Oceaniglobus ichthyenteri]|uniref:Maf family protein n=1 Tax=Oceaniglobus ichthyenteri TaxID=2136177 RepID=UPI000D3490EB|nr:Maf family nucleotide pyrophosphatase [Oceaniglobus ichthyenteri]
MPKPIILASTSDIRQQLLRNAGVIFDAVPARIDEAAIKQSMLAEQATPRDIADALAEFKARKIATKHPGAVVIGCDQVLDLNGTVLSKAPSPDVAKQQLQALSGQKHQLLSAVVVYEDAKPVWRHMNVVQMHMRTLSDDYIDQYLTRNWDSVRNCVGAYKLEEEGARLFSRVQGDYFSVLGLPLLDLLSYLTLKGMLDS